MTQNQLLESLAEHGYPLLLPGQVKPESVLLALAEQEDTRLLEGFPVVLANILRQNRTLDWELPGWKPAMLPAKARKRMPFFLALSSLLYEKYEEAGEGLSKRTLELLLKFENGKTVLKQLAGAFEQEKLLKLPGHTFSAERLKNSFQTYRTYQYRDEALEQKKHELEFELLLSEVFTPRQKALLRKKQAGKPLTKTEREYYSRVLKKRLKALASEELQAFAHRLLIGTP